MYRWKAIGAKCRLTSRWPLKAAWCSAVRPARSDTFTLLSKGTSASAQRTALLAAATCSGVCQFLSRAFTSAECFNSTCTASCKGEAWRNTQQCVLTAGSTVCTIYSEMCRKCIFQEKALPHCMKLLLDAEESTTYCLWHLLSPLWKGKTSIHHSKLEENFSE